LWLVVLGGSGCLKVSVLFFCFGGEFLSFRAFLAFTLRRFCGFDCVVVGFVSVSLKFGLSKLSSSSNSMSVMSSLSSSLLSVLIASEVSELSGCSRFCCSCLCCCRCSSCRLSCSSRCCLSRLVMSSSCCCSCCCCCCCCCGGVWIVWISGVCPSVCIRSNLCESTSGKVTSMSKFRLYESVSIGPNCCPRRMART